jgi:hypothetical protein
MARSPSVFPAAPFCPQRAVIVEHRDTVPLRDEVRRVRIGHGGDELHD